ncbi:MAG: hypothetical protein HY906_01885 [Deltaproteobacteria bacterium]|nr:hypothetical protein [Deltaproteobacteria bacterium]
MSPLETAAVSRLGTAISLIGQGALSDAREALEALEAQGPTALSELIQPLALLAAHLGRSLASKETALAALQFSLLELEAAREDLRARAEMLREAQKLESVGQLAAGIAHEVNNPLGVILGFAQGIERRLAEGDALSLPVSSIVREALRCKSLVQELLVFSRTAAKSSEPTDVNKVVHSAMVLLRARATTLHAVLEEELRSAPTIVLANRTLLQQVFVNLGNNALDAMPQGGTLSVRTNDTADGAVQVEVRDTGSGVPDAIRHRVFEPFFTTKEVGKGTGLGLSLAHEIVTQHGGEISLESELGAGTTVRVRLPRLKPARTIPADEGAGP